MKGIGSSNLNLFPSLGLKNHKNGHPNVGSKKGSKLLTYNRNSDDGTNKVGKLSCKGLIMRMIINFVAEQVVNAYIYLC